MISDIRQTHRDRGDEQNQRKTNAPEWTLPAIVGVAIKRVHFDKPRVRYVSGKRTTHNKAVQISVRLDGKVPYRAAPPILLIGDKKVTAFDRRDDGAYDFYGFDEDAYREGSEIRLAWADFPASQDKTDHRYVAP